MKYRIAIIWIAKKCYVILTHPGFIPVFTENMSTLPQYYLGDPVYPCVYREHVSSFSLASRWDGLSLCVQGTCHWMQTTGRVHAVYPCVYREHEYGRRKAPRAHGLSLCVQGTQLQLPHHPNKLRFIPVCTGNTRYIVS